MDKDKVAQYKAMTMGSAKKQESFSIRKNLDKIFFLFVGLIVFIGFMSNRSSSDLSSLPYVVFFGVLYFIPSIAGKDHENKSAILTLNIFLGWTLIGWVIALVWAMKKPTTHQGGKATSDNEASSASRNKKTELKELFELKEKGVITQEEFDKMKAKLVG